MVVGGGGKIMAGWVGDKDMFGRGYWLLIYAWSLMVARFSNTSSIGVSSLTETIK